MGAQRIYLRDTGHSGHKGGAYGATGSHQISVLIGLPHQLLCNDIHNRKSVGDDGMKLPLQPVHNDFRQVLPVHLMGPVITYLGQRLVGILDNRRTLVRPHRCNPLAHIRNLPGVGNYHLMGLIRPQIGKFLQHLLCCPEIQGGLVIRILKSLAGHNDSAVYLVLGVQEMNVAGGADQLVKLHSQFHYLFIDIYQILLGFHRALLVPEHECIVSQRLDFQVIIEIHKPGNLCVRCAAKQGLVQFPGLTG